MLQKTRVCVCVCVCVLEWGKKGNWCAWVCVCMFRVCVTWVYACEVWGNDVARETELLQMKYCKHVLYVHRYTSTGIVYGELGIYPVEISVKCRMMNYWFRLLMGKSSELCHVMYQCLLRLYQSGLYLSPVSNVVCRAYG